MLLNDLDAAVESFKKALELEPNDGSCLFKFWVFIFIPGLSSCYTCFVEISFLKSMDFFFFTGEDIVEEQISWVLDEVVWTEEIFLI